jgi:hypothetical protein
MTALRTLAEVEAAGARLAAAEPPLTDAEIADLVVILSPAFPAAPVKAVASKQRRTIAA